MKKLLFLFAVICTVSFVVSSANFNPGKAVRQADKASNDFSKLAEARKLIKDALADSGFIPDAYTWQVAGKIEKEAYRHYYKLLSINRNDPSVDHVAMADALMNAYNYYVMCMSVDTVVDKKGKQRTKYSSEISEWICDVAPAMYNAGIAYMNKKLYYPKAYNAFLEYASLPDKSWGDLQLVTNDSLRANAYYYAGVMAYRANEFEKALQTFSLARKYGYNKKEVFLNQMSSLSNIAKTNPENIDSISKLITGVARDGLAVHGVGATPLFIQKYVAGLMLENSPELAMAALDTALVSHPDMVILHTMKAGIYNVLGDYDAADNTYMKAASYPDADFNTLKAASKHLAERGIEKLDAIKGRSRDAKARAKAIKADYLKPSLEFAIKADSISPDDPEIRNTIETVSYRLH